MTIEELIVYGKKYVHSHQAKMLLANVLNQDSLELLTHLDDIVDPVNIQKYKEYIQKVVNHEPLQYILGKVNFYGYDFDINKNVLIPRFETEQLVFYAAQFIERHSLDKGKLIDLGCGSGVIGITLAKLFPSLEVSLLDISQSALDVAKKNAEKLGETTIRFLQGDMLNGINEQFDIIISNPPYIALEEEIEDIVKVNEPPLALYGGIDGLDFYRDILRQAKKNLHSNFLIAFEIGSKQAEALKKLAYEYLSNIEVEVFQDLSSRDRVVLIHPAHMH